MSIQLPQAQRVFYQSKTGRIYGALTKQVLEVAKRGKPFTRHDVLDGSDQVYNRLHNMAKNGVLKIVRKGNQRTRRKPNHL